MDVGAIHGIPEGESGDRVRLALYPLGTPFEQMRHNIPELRTARADAERLADILQAIYGYEVKLFTDRQATSANIWN